jgi:hypothetical protein
MTHDELLAKLWILPDSVTELQHGAKAVHALRAVVELHKPKKGTWWITNPDLLACSVCIDKVRVSYELEPETYPCPTIRAIEKELQ